MFVYNDLIQGVNMETGRPRYDIGKMMFTDLEDRQNYVPDAENVAIGWCPGIAARNWQNDAYSPRTGLVYTPTSNDCGIVRMVEGEYVPGDRYTLAFVSPAATIWSLGHTLVEPFLHLSHQNQHHVAVRAHFVPVNDWTMAGKDSRPKSLSPNLPSSRPSHT